MKMIFKILEFISGKNRYYYWTGVNSVHTQCGQDELEKAGVFYAVDDIYNYSSEDSMNGRPSIGLGNLNVLQRAKVRFVLWFAGVKGRLWYTI